MAPGQRHPSAGEPSPPTAGPGASCGGGAALPSGRADNRQPCRNPPHHSTAGHPHRPAADTWKQGFRGGRGGAHSPGVKTRPPAAPSGCCGRPRRRPSARRPPAHAASTARRVGRAPPWGSRGAGRTCRSARMRAPAGDAASAFLRKGRPASRPCAAPCPRTPLRTGRSCVSTARRPSPSVRRRGPSGGDELTGADPAVGLGPSHMGPRSGDRPHHARTRRGAPRAGREGGQRPDARVGSCPSSETPRPSSS